MTNTNDLDHKKKLVCGGFAVSNRHVITTFSCAAAVKAFNNAHVARVTARPVGDSYSSLLKLDLSDILLPSADVSSAIALLELKEPLVDDIEDSALMRGAGNSSGLSALVAFGSRNALYEPVECQGDRSNSSDYFSLACETTFRQDVAVVSGWPVVDGQDEVAPVGMVVSR